MRRARIVSVLALGVVATGLVDSRNAARRVLADGGVSLNNAKVVDAEAVLGEDDFLHGQVAVLKRGRKSMATVRRVG